MKLAFRFRSFYFFTTLIKGFYFSTLFLISILNREILQNTLNTLHTLINDIHQCVLGDISKCHISIVSKTHWEFQCVLSNMKFKYIIVSITHWHSQCVLETIPFQRTYLFFWLIHSTKMLLKPFLFPLEHNYRPVSENKEQSVSIRSQVVRHPEKYENTIPGDPLRDYIRIWYSSPCRRERMKFLPQVKVKNSFPRGEASRERIFYLHAG